MIREANLTNSNRPKSISLGASKSPYQDGARYLIIPKDLELDFTPGAAIVQSHSGTGAWLRPENSEHDFPAVGELLLIEFKGEAVHTHQVQVLSKNEKDILVSIPKRKSPFWLPVPAAMTIVSKSTSPSASKPIGWSPKTPLRSWPV